MPNIISLEIDGNSYTALESFSIEKDIENLCGTFSVTASAPSNDQSEFGKLVDLLRNSSQPITIAVDGEPVITGYIDEFNSSYSAQAHTISLSGRDKTSDFVDSTLDAKTFNPPIGFEELLKKLLTLVGYSVVSKYKPIGLTAASNQISIINTYGLIPRFTTSEGIQLRHSESAFSLIKRCAEVRQLILNSDGDGNIIIRSIGDEEALTILQNIKSDASAQNNLKNASVRYSFNERFNQYTIKSMTTQGNKGGSVIGAIPSANNNETVSLSNSFTPQIGRATDPDIRSSRRFTAIGSKAMTASDCKKRAEWEANIRKTKSFSYTCDVVGFRQNLKEIGSLGFAVNPLWKPNQLVYVVDEFAGIDNELLIKSVNYTQDLNGGSITKLELVDRNAYTRSIFEPLLRRKIDNEKLRGIVVAGTGI